MSGKMNGKDESKTGAGKKTVTVSGRLPVKPKATGQAKPTGKAASPVSLVIATPSYGDSFCGAYLRSVMALVTWAERRGTKLSWSFFDYADIAATRNILLSKFWYQHPNATHLLFLDDDMGFPVSLVERALALDKDLVGALYPKRRMDAAALHAAGDEPLGKALAKASGFVGKLSRVSVRQDGFQTADYIGTGFMLIRRASLARFLDLRPKLRSEKRYKSVLADWPHADFLTAFDRLTVNGSEYSEDYAFCHRWRQAGLEIWAAPDADIVHVGRHEFRAKYSDL